MDSMSVRSFTKSMLPGTIQAYHLGLDGTDYLKGIFFARMLHGDWRNAYLVLEKVLYYWLNIQGLEIFLATALTCGPISEGYQIFLQPLEISQLHKAHKICFTT